MQPALNGQSTSSLVLYDDLKSTMASRRRHFILGLAALLGVLGPGCQSAPPSGVLPPTPPRSAALTPAPQSAAAEEAKAEEAKYIRWLVEHSMLHQAEVAGRRYAGQGQLWQHPYAAPQPRAASALASAWFTAYPAAQITRPGEPVLWRLFREIGVTAVHTGPMKRAGGIRGYEFTPTIDGNFDRISSEIDPAFGTEDEYRA